MVAYRALYYDMFLDEVNKNSQIYRFELQEIKSLNEK